MKNDKSAQKDIGELELLQREINSNHRLPLAMMEKTYVYCLKVEKDLNKQRSLFTKLLTGIYPSKTIHKTFNNFVNPQRPVSKIPNKQEQLKERLKKEAEAELKKKNQDKNKK